MEGYEWYAEYTLENDHAYVVRATLDDESEA